MPKHITYVFRALFIGYKIFLHRKTHLDELGDHGVKAVQDQGEKQDRAGEVEIPLGVKELCVCERVGARILYVVRVVVGLCLEKVAGRVDKENQDKDKRNLDGGFDLWIMFKRGGVDG